MAAQNNGGKAAPGRPFAKGDPRINAGGRPKGFAGVAKLIMAETRSGAEMVEFALKVFRNKPRGGKGKGAKTPPYSLDAQVWAQQWLTDRCIGKAMQIVDLDPHDTANRVPTSTASRGELAALLKEAMATPAIGKPKKRRADAPKPEPQADSDESKPTEE